MLATSTSLTSTGRALFFTSFVLTFGFMILAFAYFWYGGNKTWQTFYTEYPRHLVSFYRTPDDALQAEPRGEVFVPLQSLAILEYDDECGGCLTEWMGGCC